jgi:HSP20 family protein
LFHLFFVATKRRLTMWSLMPWKKPAGGSLASQPLERDFSRLRSDFDSLLDRMWHSWPLPADEWLDGRLGGGLDVEETDAHYIFHVTAPGFEVGDFDVSASAGQLVVKAEQKESANGGNGSSFRYGRIQRIIPLPDGVETDRLEAEYRAGILRLKVPKGRATQPKRIPVKSA